MHRLLIVDIALVYAEELVEILGGIDRITHPVDITDIELITLIYLDIDTQGLLVDIVYRITHNSGVAVASRVIEVEK
jgi:hypothetical protein